MKTTTDIILALFSFHPPNFYLGNIFNCSLIGPVGILLFCRWGFSGVKNAVYVRTGSKLLPEQGQEIKMKPRVPRSNAFDSFEKQWRTERGIPLVDEAAKKRRRIRFPFSFLCNKD